MKLFFLVIIGERVTFNITKGEYMQKNILNKFIFAVGLASSLLSHQVSYGVVAYMPVVLRECLTNIYEINGRSKGSDLEELCAMIQANRVLASDQMVRKVLLQALDILQNNANFDNAWRDGAAIYLQNYLDTLNTKSILCSLQGSNDALITIPSALVARSLEIDATSKEILYLSGQLAQVQNIELCGNESINSDFSQLIPAHVVNVNQARASLIFNADMLSSPNSTTPDVVFGTGVSTPVITAWAMPPAGVVRKMPTRALITTPVTLQFSIPTNFKRDKSVSLKLHFLVDQQGFAAGKARIQVDALYTGDNDQFSLSDTTHVDYSKDFTVKEPTNGNEFRHIYISIPLEKSHIKKNKFAMLTLGRIEPNGTEYAGEIYLVAAEFKYTEKEDEDDSEDTYCW